ncbi:MAG: hypothetical protein LUD18_07465 [Lachnospiraceae bacterium]|nr:hypothetical protein [Lachnospiraceae bacterium]
MEEKKLGEGMAALEDDALDEVSGGASAITLTGELQEYIYARDKMRTLWSRIESHGDYGKQVKKVVNEYTKNNNLEESGLYYRAKKAISVYAKNSYVTVNGKVISQ